MKKTKWTWTFLSLAIIISICSAFATRPKFDCSQAQQYRLIAGDYYPAGIYGIDYICVAASTTCTYFTVNGGITYSPCQLGTYDDGGGFAIKSSTFSVPTPNNQCQ